MITIVVAVGQPKGNFYTILGSQIKVVVLGEFSSRFPAQFYGVFASPYSHDKHSLLQQGLVWVPTIKSILMKLQQWLVDSFYHNGHKATASLACGYCCNFIKTDCTTKTLLVMITQLQPQIYLFSSYLKNIMTLYCATTLQHNFHLL